MPETYSLRGAEAGRDAFFEWVKSLSPQIAQLFVPDRGYLEGYLAWWLDRGDGANYARDGYGSWMRIMILIIEAWTEDPGCLKCQDGSVISIQAVYDCWKGSVFDPRRIKSAFHDDG